MKVLIVSFYYSPELGAAPSRITNLAKGLQEKGIEVELLTCMPNYPKGKIFEGYRRKFSMKEELDGVVVHRYWTYATTSKNTFRRLWSMTSFALAIWILVAYSAMVIFRCLYRRITVLNVSDLWPASAVELGVVREGGVFYQVLAFIEKFLYKNASAVMGQSSVILKHVLSYRPLKKTFLYRNLQHAVRVDRKTVSKRGKFKIVYAGLMGVAQDILGLIKAVDFAGLNVEFHLYGGGNQLESIKEYISGNDKEVYYHGFLNKEQMVQELMNYDASIVPLVVSLKGAGPA